MTNRRQFFGLLALPLAQQKPKPAPKPAYRTADLEDRIAQLEAELGNLVADVDNQNSANNDLFYDAGKKIKRLEYRVDDLESRRR